MSSIWRSLHEPHQWFVGFSIDPLETMIVTHGVDEEKDLWIYRECLSATDAKLVISQLRSLNKCDSIDTLQKPEEKYVYVYKKNARTTP